MATGNNMHANWTRQLKARLAALCKQTAGRDTPIPPRGNVLSCTRLSRDDQGRVKGHVQDWLVPGARAGTAVTQWTIWDQLGRHYEEYVEVGGQRVGPTIVADHDWLGRETLRRVGEVTVSRDYGAYHLVKTKAPNIEFTEAFSRYHREFYVWDNTHNVELERKRYSLAGTPNYRRTKRGWEITAFDGVFRLRRELVLTDCGQAPIAHSVSLAGGGTGVFPSVLEFARTRGFDQRGLLTDETVQSAVTPSDSIRCEYSDYTIFGPKVSKVGQRTVEKVLAFDGNGRKVRWEDANLTMFETAHDGHGELAWLQAKSGFGGKLLMHERSIVRDGLGRTVFAFDRQSRHYEYDWLRDIGSTMAGLVGRLTGWGPTIRPWADVETTPRRATAVEYAYDTLGLRAKQIQHVQGLPSRSSLLCIEHPAA